MVCIVSFLLAASFANESNPYKYHIQINRRAREIPRITNPIVREKTVAATKKLMAIINLLLHFE